MINCYRTLGDKIAKLDALEKNNIKSHSIVVGGCALEVIKCVSSRFPQAGYVFQAEQRGPVDALRCAVEAMPQNMPPDTLLLVTPAHRIIKPEIISSLLDFYYQNDLKLATAFLTDPSGGTPLDLTIGLGRLADIKSGVQELIQSADHLEELKMPQLAQIMNGHDRGVFLVQDWADVMGFNNPEEFLLVTDMINRQQGNTPSEVSELEYHSLQSWLQALSNHEAGDSVLTQELYSLYGGNADLVARQHDSIRQLLQAAAKFWDMSALVTVIRSPGRVNTMGRHVDHQGGNCNLMTIGYETLMAACRRNDDKVILRNLDPEFEPVEFSIGELVRDLPWDDWQTLVGSAKLAKLLKQYGVNWSDYIKAVFLRFQKHFFNQRLCGMEIIVSGNVPMAAGLSSSSTLVVGAAEAVVGANRLDLESDKLITLCGEGEWFVGTRGGAADHAAVKLGACNKVVKVGFFDFKVEKMVNFPEDYTLIVGDSGIKARKSSNAKDQFNHRVSCYRIGLLLLKKLFPQYASRLQHLRDFSCRNLGIPLDWLYKLLIQLPEYATRQELEAMLPESDLSVFWNNHAEPADKLYPIRGVVIYGLAECERSRRYADCLEQGNMDEVGLMMNISHDGDRVVKFDGSGEKLSDYYFDSSDAALQRLINALQCKDPLQIESAQLWKQAGSYRCSLPDIDRMVDLACGVPGVVGAQLAGAGLGGCMMVLLRTSAIDDLTNTLTGKYYQIQGLPPRLLQCRPIAGAGPIRWQE